MTNPDINTHKYLNNFKKDDQEEMLRRVGEMKYGSNITSVDREKARRKFFHDASNNIETMKKLIAIDKIIENAYYLKNMAGSNYNVLWIENKPDNKIRCIEKLTGKNFLFKCLFEAFSDYPDVTLLFLNSSAEFENLEQKISSKNNDLIQFKKLNNKSIEETEQCEKTLSEIDLVLLDIYLDSDTIYGEKFINIFIKNYPSIPILILSNSEDYDLVERCLRLGADFYVNKKFVSTVPGYLHKTYEKYGNILYSHLGHSDIGKELRRNTLGNIRYWMHHKNLLWYGDKCYHMIEHAYEHTMDNWKHTNQIFPLVEEILFKDIIEKDRMVYCFSMATWLHDIGHKGNERFGEAYQIRDMHGLISAELIIKNPQMFNIIEGVSNKNFDDNYQEFEFPLGNHHEPLPQLIRDCEEKDKYLTNLEIIALLCMYHKSNAPLTRKEGWKMQSERKFIPKDYFTDSDPENGYLITLEDILKKRLPEKDSNIDLLLTMAVLFRFIDGLDIHGTRVGDNTEKELKTTILDQDLICSMKTLEKIVDIMIDRLVVSGKINNCWNRKKFIRWKLSNDRVKTLILKKLLYYDQKEKIEKRTFEFDQPYTDFLTEKLGNVDDYSMALRYASFISVQDGHFNLHSCVDDIQI